MQSLCGAEGLRSDLRAHVCSCRHGSTEGWAVRPVDAGLQVLPPAAWKSGSQKICHQACRAASTRSAEHMSRFSFFGFFQKDGDVAR